MIQAPARHSFTNITGYQAVRNNKTAFVQFGHEDDGEDTEVTKKDPEIRITEQELRAMIDDALRRNEWGKLATLGLTYIGLGTVTSQVVNPLLEEAPPEPPTREEILAQRQEMARAIREGRAHHQHHDHSAHEGVHSEVSLRNISELMPTEVAVDGVQIIATFIIYGIIRRIQRAFRRN